MATLTEHPTTGLLNLEKELVCFICTEVLYQPLTLLDCLHTFCGSCLKEWFSHQYRKAVHSHSSSANPYTCPTCRSPVKDAQHNAMINTLLEMFLSANPTKDRSAEEKAEMAQVFKPGDEILPKVESHRRRERRRRDDDEVVARERRLATDGHRDRSRRDQQLSPGSAEQRRPTSGSSRSRERRTTGERQTDSDRRQRREQQLSTDAATDRPRTGGSTSSVDLTSVSPPPSSPRHPDAVEARQRGARTVAHQASLISLVSASESGTGTGDSLSEAQLMQEILAEGLLDGINVDDLTEAEQDELSEIIAERYRQLHPERVRRAASDESRPGSAANPTTQTEVQVDEAGRRRRQTSRSSQRQQPPASPRSANSVIIGGSDGRPPTAFPQCVPEHTLTPPQEAAHRRRASNESRRSEPSMSRAARAPHPGESRTHATRSATDLSDRPQSQTIISQRQQQNFTTHRSNTEPRSSPRASEAWQAAGSRLVSSPPQVTSPGQQSPRNDPVQPIMSSVNTGPVPTSMPLSDPAAMAPEPAALSASTVSARFEEPYIECARCSRPNIQYEVYKHCGPCRLDLCLRCYRAGRGCNHWFGFGHAAMTKFDASQPPNRNTLPIELPHLLIGRQYQRLFGAATQIGGTVPPAASDPNLRLREGNFCDRCGSFANDCFWSCDYCNDGEWGFCNDCVNTNHCCDHPLLPVAHKSFDPNSTNPRQGGAITHAGTVTLSPYTPTGRATSPAQSAGSSVTSAIGGFAGLRVDFVPLVVTTNCDICSRPISPQETRYHCPGHPTPSPENPHQKGDFDICISCYHSFAKTGRVKRDDGPEGWRLCPDGHRMVAVAFEPDGEGNQHRVITRDLVGGVKTTDADVAAWKVAANASQRPDQAMISAARGSWTWKEDEAGTRRASRARASTLSLSGSTATRFPPDGGIGKVCRARWSYYPEEGEKGKGELLFPKFGSIREIEEVNEEWWFGAYAGDMGLFPAIFVKDRI